MSKADDIRRGLESKMKREIREGGGTSQQYYENYDRIFRKVVKCSLCGKEEQDLIEVDELSKVCPKCYQLTREE